MSNKENTRFQFHQAILDIANSNEKLINRIYNAFINHLLHISDDDIPANFKSEWAFVLQELSFKIPKKIETHALNLKQEGISKRSIDSFLSRIEEMHPPLFLKEVHHTKVKRISKIICSIYEDLYRDLEEELTIIEKYNQTNGKFKKANL